MQGTEQYHQEYHLEECNEEVGGGECQAENPGYCRAGALQGGNPEGIEAATDPVVGILIILSDVVVADVSARGERRAIYWELPVKKISGLRT